MIDLNFSFLFKKNILNDYMWGINLDSDVILVPTIRKWMGLETVPPGPMPERKKTEEVYDSYPMDMNTKTNSQSWTEWIKSLFLS